MNITACKSLLLGLIASSSINCMDAFISSSGSIMGHSLASLKHEKVDLSSRFDANRHPLSSSSSLNALRKPWMKRSSRISSSRNHDNNEEEEESDDDILLRRRVQGGGVPSITVINSTEDFIEFLSKDDRLCIIKFYASWCKSCQKFGVRFKKLAATYGDLVEEGGERIVDEGEVRFAEVEFSKNAKFCRTLGIKRLPFLHYYRGAEGRIAAFSAGPSKFNLVIDTMHDLLNSSDEERAFNILMHDGEDLGKYIVTELTKEHWEQVLGLEQKKKTNKKAHM